ncbi:hypothetical protein AWN88_00910 [Agrobacterium tumefaciens]|nr:hypothetical protein AWN88_00910 [Agrobacterium tumefaciens]KAJ32308.1 hypothetical protein BW45_24240 [Agrobacterium tumefaciens]
MTDERDALKAEIETLRAEYMALLDTGDKEQVYQRYLEENTRLIPRDFVQNHGVSCKIVLRKPAFGADYKSDFFFLSKSTVLWHAVHIEIEKPSSKYFKEGTNEFHADFVHAQQQINDWQAWMYRNNEAAFRGAVSALMVPLANNPVEHKYVLVYGRRGEYIGNEIRRSKIAALVKSSGIKIMSFDSLAEDLSGKPPVNIGIRKNEYIDVIGDELMKPEACAFIEPTLFRVSQSAKDRLMDMDGGGPYMRSFRVIEGERVDAYKYVGANVWVRGDQEPVIEE